MLTWVHYLVEFAVALIVTALLVPPVRAFATSHGIVDKPSPRRVNKVPVPRMGGLAMYGGFMAAIAAEYVLEATGFWFGPFLTGNGPNTQVIGIVVGISAVVALGVLDDVYSLKAGVKFGGQIVAACIVAFSGTLIMRFHMPFSSEIVSFGNWSYLITVIYLVCFINIINLIDGLDGLAAGISGIAALALFFIVSTLLRTDAALFSIVIVGMCLAFLFYNFYPASIFMGDSGSMMLGLLLGTISLLGAARFASITILLVPIVIAFVPIMDTLGAIIRRTRRHESIAKPDKGHIHHRLLLHGYSQRKVVLLVYLWTAILSVGAVAMWEMGGVVKYVVFAVMLLASAFVSWRIGLFGPTRIRHGRPDYVYETSEERAARKKADKEAKGEKAEGPAEAEEPAEAGEGKGEGDESGA